MSDLDRIVVSRRRSFRRGGSSVHKDGGFLFESRERSFECSSCRSVNRVCECNFFVCVFPVKECCGALFKSRAGSRVYKGRFACLREEFCR